MPMPKMIDLDENSCFSRKSFAVLSAQGQSFVDIVDYAAYLVADDEDLDFELFCNIFQCNGVS